MKILLATTAFQLNGGGIASYNNELYDLFKTNHIIHLITTDNIIKSNIDGINKIYKIPEKNNLYASYLSIINEINLEEYNIIINSDSAFVAIIAPFLNAPIVTISHSYKYLPTLRASYNHEYISKIIALSHAGRKEIINFYKISDDKKVEMIYNFVKKDSSYDKFEKKDRDTLTIVYPGGASLMKYPEMVLKAVILLAKTDLNFKFFWLGNTILPLKRFSIVKDLKQLIPIDKRIIVTQKIPRKEAEKIISEANIFILPSRSEGCPISLIEALRSGCIPIVGDAKHVCREILEDGSFGVIVKHGSHEELYSAISSIIKEHPDYKYNYSRTLDYSNKILSEDIWKEKMMQVINEAIVNKKRIKELSKLSLYYSLLIYNILAFYIRIKEYWLSFKCYLKFNYYYLKFK